MRPRRLLLGWFFPGNFGLLGKNRISFCFDLFLIEMDCIPTVTSDPGQLLHQNNYQNMSYLYTLRQFNIAMENVHVSQVDHLLSWVIFHIFHGYQRIHIPSIPKLMVNHHVPQSPHQNCAINWGIHCIHLFFFVGFSFLFRSGRSWHRILRVCCFSPRQHESILGPCTAKGC